MENHQIYKDFNGIYRAFNGFISGWWLSQPSEKWWSSSNGMMIPFPTEWKVIIQPCSSHQPDYIPIFEIVLLGLIIVIHTHPLRDPFAFTRKVGARSHTSGVSGLGIIGGRNPWILGKFLGTLQCWWSKASINGLVYIRENWNRKAPYSMGKSLVSGSNFPLNQSIESKAVGFQKLLTLKSSEMGLSENRVYSQL